MCSNRSGVLLPSTTTKTFHQLNSEQANQKACCLGKIAWRILQSRTSEQQSADWFLTRSSPFMDYKSLCLTLLVIFAAINTMINLEAHRKRWKFKNLIKTHPQTESSSNRSRVDPLCTTTSLLLEKSRFQGIHRRRCPSISSPRFLRAQTRCRAASQIVFRKKDPLEHSCDTSIRVTKHQSRNGWQLSMGTCWNWIQRIECRYRSETLRFQNLTTHKRPVCFFDPCTINEFVIRREQAITIGVHIDLQTIYVVWSTNPLRPSSESQV